MLSDVVSRTLGGLHSPHMGALPVPYARKPHHVPHYTKAAEERQAPVLIGGESAAARIQQRKSAVLASFSFLSGCRLVPLSYITTLKHDLLSAIYLKS